MKNTQKIYNKTADLWVRKNPNSLSDFTARPRIIESCGDVSGLKIVDLGCGEGYMARILESKKAAKIDGIELSQKMVDLAKTQQNEKSIIDYTCGNVVALPYDDEKYDLAIGVFVYNYLNTEDLNKSFSEVYRVLKNNGRFIFSVPHPAFPFIKKDIAPPFYFNLEGHGYYSSRNRVFNGKIYCRDKKELSVQMIPKTLEDYFSALKTSGFENIPQVQELGVTDEMMELDEEFFSPVFDMPLHMLFILTK